MGNEHFSLRGYQVWPTMLFTRQWERHRQESPGIIAFLYQLRQSQANPIDSGIAVGAKSASGLYESDFDLFKREQTGLHTLANFIRSSLALAASIANNNEHRPDQLSVELTDSWYHITNQGGYHDAHVHNDCSWCGIYYLQLGSAGQRTGASAPNGGSRFYCPILNGGAYRDYGNKYLTSTIDPPLSEGMLLLFPSYLWHSGLPYQGDVDRIVIAFNARVLCK